MRNLEPGTTLESGEVVTMTTKYLTLSTQGIDTYLLSYFNLLIIFRVSVLNLGFRSRCLNSGGKNPLVASSLPIPTYDVSGC